MAQLALAWLISHDNHAAIAGARNPEQITSNAKAGQIELSEDQVEILSEISSPLKDHFSEDLMQWG